MSTMLMGQSVYVWHAAVMASLLQILCRATTHTHIVFTLSVIHTHTHTHTVFTLSHTHTNISLAQASTKTYIYTHAEKHTTQSHSSNKHNKSLAQIINIFIHILLQGQTSFKHTNLTHRSTQDCLLT
ncbi:hypothetical protein AALO_G00230220 [Alosa alosa]|uniref:Secreted protein n=1 Tax=Alosa alosa TaxID=278164 RepID=A0AAV6FYL6_9TELE|nr:hypothetical protein AALO_G00230220 [Alosa alosa]